MLVMSHCKRQKQRFILEKLINFYHAYNYFSNLETIVKRFKKLLFDKKFDFNLIFSTTNDAVHYVNELKIRTESAIIFDQFSPI